MNKARNICNMVTVSLAIDRSGINELNCIEKEKEGMPYGSQSMAGTCSYV